MLGQFLSARLPVPALIDLGRDLSFAQQVRELAALGLRFDCHICVNIAHFRSIFAIGRWLTPRPSDDDAAMESSYRCSEMGLAAWRREDPQLAPEERQILAVLQRQEGSLQRLRRHADRLRLADLVARGLVIPS